MATSRTGSEIFDDVKRKFNIESLTTKQIESIEAFMAKKDVFISTRTGSGKSLSYECVPIIDEGGSVLVIAPLTTIMTEQCDTLESLGFRATYIGKDPKENEAIGNGEYDFVFTSPEHVVGKVTWRKVLMTSKFTQRLKLIAVDEAHTVLQWGEGKSDESPFREWFSKIGELRSLFPKIPMMAMTATASPLSRKRIMKSLNFHSSRAVILDSPDRTNIKISSHQVSTTANVRDTFSWLMQGLEAKGDQFDRHLVFCSTINDCAKIYAAFISHFGRGYAHVNMYHSKTNETVKEKIRDDMKKEDGVIRILICTNAAGMGVNFKAVNNVVHFGLPREMDTFLQQMGRAGRDGSAASELILLKLHKTHLKRTEPDLVHLARNQETCRHKIVCESYLCEHVSIKPKHDCCDVCALVCKCGQEECPRLHPVKSYVQEDNTDTEELCREVSHEDRDILRQQLKSLQLAVEAETSSGTLVDTSMFGLSTCLVEEVVNKCSYLFTPVDVISHTTCWSYNMASMIMDKINIVFGDLEMYGLDNEDSENDSENDSDQ